MLNNNGFVPLTSTSGQFQQTTSSLSNSQSSAVSTAAKIVPFIDLTGLSSASSIPTNQIQQSASSSSSSSSTSSHSKSSPLAKKRRVSTSSSTSTSSSESSFVMHQVKSTGKVCFTLIDSSVRGQLSEKLKGLLEPLISGYWSKGKETILKNQASKTRRVLVEYKISKSSTTYKGYITKNKYDDILKIFEENSQDATILEKRDFCSRKRKATSNKSSAPLVTHCSQPSSSIISVPVSSQLSSSSTVPAIGGPVNTTPTNPILPPFNSSSIPPHLHAGWTNASLSRDVSNITPLIRFRTCAYRDDHPY